MRPQRHFLIRGSDERGASAVEFGLILPILVLLLMGIMEFGRAFHAQITVTHAAREAVRVYVLGSGNHVATAESASWPLEVEVSPPAPGECEPPGNPTTVTVSHAFDFIVPMFGTTLTLTGIGEMRCGG